MTNKILSRKRQQYIDKFKDPRWQKLRLEIFERDGWSCVYCGCKDTTLNAHHMFYRDEEDECEPWDYPNSSLATLCEPCHKAEHESLYLSRKYLINSVSGCGLGLSEFLSIIAEGFSFGMTSFNEKDASVLAFVIQSMIASRNVLHGTASKKDMANAAGCVTDPDVWEHWEKTYRDSLPLRLRKKMFPSFNEESLVKNANTEEGVL